jgi:hypothetical protein
MGLAVLTLGGCKPSGLDDGQDSTAQTLDNFARKSGAPIRMNHCGLTDEEAPEDGLPLVVKEKNIIWPDLKDNNWSSRQLKSLKKEVNKVLAQIPPSVMTLFFALDGKIDFSRTPNHSEPLWKICNKSVESDKEQFGEGNLLLSCWKRDKKTGGATIYIDPSSDGKSSFKGVHHALIRSFGYVLSQIFFYYDIAQGSAKPGQTGKEGEIYFDVFEKNKPSENSTILLENLANAFWRDVYGTNLLEGSNGDEVESGRARKYDLSAYKDMYYSKDPAEKMKFQTYVFAEAFDSFHCST